LCLDIYCPVNKVARDIQHTEVVTQLWVNRIPSWERASSVGVCNIEFTGWVLWKEERVWWCVQSSA
jgi:hypothetical protein